MKIIEVNEGPKVEHSVRKKTWLDVGDEISLNLAAREADDPVGIDIMADAFGNLHEGTGVYYVAQIEIPARQYTEEEIPNPDYDGEGGESGISPTIIRREPVPFSMDNVTLKLYALKEGV